MAEKRVRRASPASSSTEVNSDRVQHVQQVPKESTNVEPQHEIDPVVDKRVTRKCDLHIIPWLFGIWLFAFIDRSNIGNARIDGLTEDLNLQGTQFNVALVVFYVPYILVDVPSNWIVKHFKAGRYLPFLIFCWGLVSTFLGFTKSYAGLVVARAFLGFFEGGLLGGMIVYLAMFALDSVVIAGLATDEDHVVSPFFHGSCLTMSQYRRHEMLYRIGLFYCAAPLSGAFGGLLASGLAQISTGGYDSWPWIFFIEGAVTVCFGVLSFIFMPSTPADAKFFTEEERAVAQARMVADGHGSSSNSDVNDEKFDWHWVRMALLSPNTLFCSLSWFFLLVPLYSFSLFLPTIIRALGYSATKAQLFSVPPNMAAFCLVLITAGLSDRFKARGPFMIGGAILAIAGYIMLLVASEPLVRYGGTFFVASGVFVGSPMVMGWLSNNTAPHFVRATASGFQIAFANCAAFIATFTYLQEDAPDYKLGHSINLGALVLCIITVAAGIFYCKWENAKRDRGERDHRLTEGDESRLGHRHPNFRYTI